MSQFSLEGQIALVTGGGRGIGLGIATSLAQAGADVVIADYTKDLAEAGADAVQRRYAAHQHVVKAMVTVGLLQHRQIGRHLDDTQLRRIPLGVGTTAAHLVLAEGIAAGAMAQYLKRMTEGHRQSRRTALVALQQMVGHPLGGLRPDARQAAQGFD